MTRLPRFDHRRNKLWAVLVGLMAATLLLSACSQDESAETESAGQAADEAESAEEEIFQDPSSDDAMSDDELAGAEDSDDDVDVVRAPGQQDRLIQRDASVTLEVDDLAASIVKVNEAIVGDGAYLASEETNERTSYLTFKVPSEDFDETLDQLPDFGKLRSQEVSSNDRTDAIIDLRSRLETAERSLERTRGFFDEATSVKDLTELEAQLAEREAQVATLKAQLQNEERSVALSTISVSLELAPDQDVDLVEDPGPGLFDALGNGFSALAAVLYAAFLVVAWLLPWLPIIVAVAFGVRWLSRRAKKRRAEKLAAFRAVQQEHAARSVRPTPVPVPVAPTPPGQPGHVEPGPEPESDEE